MSSTLRFKVVGEAFHKKPIEVPTPEERPSEFFGKYVFNRQKMFKYLPAWNEAFTLRYDSISSFSMLSCASMRFPFHPTFI